MEQETDVGSRARTEDRHRRALLHDRPTAGHRSREAGSEGQELLIHEVDQQRVRDAPFASGSGPVIASRSDTSRLARDTL